jgi:hypothetical protein
MAWITASEVKKYAQVKYTDFMEGSFASETELDSFITDSVIPAVESHIEAYCRRDFDADYPSGIPNAIKDVARRASTNILQYMIMNKMGPLIRVDERFQHYKLGIPEQEVLTPGLKALLDPWVKASTYVKATEYKTIDE